MFMRTPIDGAGSRGFGVTRRGGTGSSLATDKGGGRMEAVRDLSHMTPEPVASQPNFIVQPLVTKEWTF